MVVSEKDKDAYGRLLMNYWKGDKEAMAIFERDDGMVQHGSCTGGYFAEYRNWPKHQREAIRLASGRVLDIGCGAGRVLLYLQSKGQEAVGIDTSPLALEVCRMRGANDVRLVSLMKIDASLGKFDAVVMYGNNFGLVGTPERGHRWLKKMLRHTTPRGRIIAECLDPYRSPLPEHREYHRYNRRRGRMAGQARIRVRFLWTSSDWFDLLLVSEKELENIVQNTGWHIGRIIETENIFYVAILEKD
jgi:SAM-dependent methyltransferase